MFLGPQSVIYPTNDLDAAKAWWTRALGVAPYFVAKAYVGFNVNGDELGLFPDADPGLGPLTYWGTPNIEQALEHLLGCEASQLEEVHDVGGGIRMASVRSPEGYVFGLIENPTRRV